MLRTENARASRAITRLMAIVEWNEHRLQHALEALQILRNALGEAYAKPADSLLIAITIADLTLKPETDYLSAVNALAERNSRGRPAPESFPGMSGATEEQGAPQWVGEGAPPAAVGGTPSRDRSAQRSSARDRARSAGGTALATTTIDDRNLRQSGGPGHSGSQPQPQHGEEDHGS